MKKLYIALLIHSAERLVAGKHLGFENNTISVGKLSKGIYILKITDQNKNVQIKKLLIE
jgi:hypothetical protein